MVSELFRAFQRFLEVFRGFQRFSEVFRGFQRFQRPSQRPSQSAIFLSELRVVLPLIVLPLKTPANHLGETKDTVKNVKEGEKMVAKR